jgi:CDP-paratose 2-epimerase
VSTVVITGAAGLIGSESAKFFGERGYNVVGIDNDMRSYFFGPGASTSWNRSVLERELGVRYVHHAVDIRDQNAVERIFSEFGGDIALVIHSAAQPSHDWAAREPHTDFTVNANGTLTVLEAARKYAPGAVFIFTSTNKVYGDTPNRLPLQRLETRWEIEPSHPFAEGIDESMSIDNTLHSLFGASKVAADVLVQEYGRYFGMKTAIFRGGCLTGPAHSGAQLHGFLAYLMQCAVRREPYTIFGYEGRQVRDNIHSYDLVSAFNEVFLAPRVAEVYNIGGSRYSNCSMLEAIAMCEEITGNKVTYTYADQNRTGDHIWYISDVRKLQSHYPDWKYTKGMREILVDIFEAQVAKV